MKTGIHALVAFAAIDAAHPDAWEWWATGCAVEAADLHGED